MVIAYFMMPISLAMNTPEQAREYLRASLPEGSWARTSRAIGHNPTYLQQYIRYGKPDWLGEPERDALIQLYPLDPERLRPPPTELLDSPAATRHREDQPEVHPKRLRKIVDDPRVLDLLDLLDIIVTNDEFRNLAKDILGSLANRTRAAMIRDQENRRATP